MEPAPDLELLLQRHARSLRRLAFELVRIADEEAIAGARGAGPGRTLADVLDSSAGAPPRAAAKKQ